MSFNTITQSITPADDQQCAGVDLFFTAAGGDVVVSLGLADDVGLPAPPLAQVRVPMAGIATTGEATRALFDEPVTMQAGTTYMLSVAAGDAQTALQVAQVGEASATGGWVTAAAADVGGLQQINQAGTVTRYAQRMLRFALLAMHYAATEKTVTLGTVPVEDGTSLMLMAAASQPAADARITYLLELLGGGGEVQQAMQVDAGQLVTLDAPHTGSVRVKATLRVGAGGLGAVLQPGTLLVVGTLDPSQTYITPAIATAGGDDLRVIFEADIPAGSAVAVQTQLDGGAWQPVPYQSSSPQTAGVLELTHQLDGFAADALRLRLTLTGTTKARPQVRNLRAAVL